jgi:hypothetical protein
MTVIQLALLLAIHTHTLRFSKMSSKKKNNCDQLRESNIYRRNKMLTNLKNWLMAQSKCLGYSSKIRICFFSTRGRNSVEVFVASQSGTLQ